MPGSPTTPGRPDTRVDASVHVAFRENEHVGTRIAQVFAAQWLAYALPCRRFAATLAGDNARLGAGAGRYSFTVVDLHLLLLAGFTGAPEFLISYPHQGRSLGPKTTKRMGAIGACDLHRERRHSVKYDFISDH
jgi:hypothetical protein